MNLCIWEIYHLYEWKIKVDFEVGFLKSRKRFHFLNEKDCLIRIKSSHFPPTHSNITCPMLTCYVSKYTLLPTTFLKNFNIHFESIIYLLVFFTISMCLIRFDVSIYMMTRKKKVYVIFNNN